MKPFDLEAAKNGAPVVTRDGRSVRILCTDMQGSDYPIVALVASSLREREGLITRTLSGHTLTGGGCSENDLFMATVKREGWVNIYANKHAGSYRYDTEEAAVLAAHGTVLATVKVEWEE